MNIKNYVPGEVRLDQARHKARAAFGRGRVIVNAPESEAYRRNFDLIDWTDGKEAANGKQGRGAP